MEVDVIYNTECLAGMATLPAASIDCVICDLPYGTTANRWDSVIPFEPLWAQYKRVCKPNAPILLFAQMPFAAALAASNIQWLKYEWIWVKPNATGFLQANHAPLKTHENILVFYKQAPAYNPQMRSGFKPYQCKRGTQNGNYHDFKGVTSTSDGDRYPIDLLEFNYDTDKVHPTQKPVKLVEYLIRTYTSEGDVILDNCMGSGTTAVACINTNRRYIGYELDTKYWQAAQKRIELARMQPPLFYDIK